MRKGLTARGVLITTAISIVAAAVVLAIISSGYENTFIEALEAAVSDLG